MPSVTIRNLPAEVHQALRARAERSGRSTEAEIRDILEQAALPQGRVKLGSLLVSIGREAGLSDDEAEGFNRLRERMPAEPLDLS
ncbi:MAG TPA: Arc family DNA-binding protein [Ensifer sp.]|nr:Arc family DNA-binding protein [Ensifer sp.]